MRFHCIMLSLICLLSNTICCFASADTKIASHKDTLLINAHKAIKNATSEDKQAAASLNSKADKAYRKGNYNLARRLYGNSYPNYPNAYAYIMHGDTHWRAVVEYQQTQIKIGKQKCFLNDKDFADDLDLSLIQSYEIGIALAATESDFTQKHPLLYQRAISAQQCLRKAQQSFQTQPIDTCIDIKRIEQCLSSPLI